MKTKLGSMLVIVMIASMLLGTIQTLPFVYKLQNGVFTIWYPCHPTIETGSILIEKVETHPRRTATLPLVYQWQSAGGCPAVYRNTLPPFGPGLYHVIKAELGGMEFSVGDNELFGYYPSPPLYFPLVSRTLQP